MSVNRRSDLDTSLSRTDGVHHKYLNLSSADRNKTLYPNSADAELSFDDQSNVLGMKILNFEIPHTRYAIDKTTNNLYLSEKWGEDEYYFYCLRASTGGHSVQNLCVSMELSSKCPVLLNGDRDMGNEYSFSTTSLFGKVGITSSGNHDFTIHAASATVTLSSIIVNSDTEATVSFLAPSDQMFKPGALLIFKPYTYADRDVQVVETPGTTPTTQNSNIRLIGNFSDLNGETLDVSQSEMVPYSGVNSVAKIMGFGESDIAGQTDFEILAIGSPFSGSDEFLTAMVMVATNFTAFLSPGDYVKLGGIPGFMNNAVCQVINVLDETHVEIKVDRTPLWSQEEGRVVKASDPSLGHDVTDVNLREVNNNSLTLFLSTSTTPSFAVDDSVVFRGFHSKEFQAATARVVSVTSENENPTGVTIQLDYPTTFLFNDGVSSLSPVNQETLHRTTYMAPHRFDLSRGRRMVLCRAIVDNQDVGSIHIPSVSTRSFFGRIQLFSGADLVNFLGADTAVGSHEFNSVLKRLNKIRFQFFSEDGTTYDFVGVDYTMFLELTCLDSNKGI